MTTPWAYIGQYTQ